MGSGNTEKIVNLTNDVTQYPIGVNYKKPGSKDLWCRVGDTEVNITKSRLELTNAAVSTEVSVNLIDDLACAKLLYQKNDSIYWDDMNGNAMNLLKQYSGGELTHQILAVNGDINKPGIAFNDDASLGFRLVTPDMMSYASGGKDRTLFTEHGIRTNAYHFINNTANISCVDDSVFININNNPALTISQYLTSVSNLSADKLHTNRILIDDGSLYVSDGYLVWERDGSAVRISEDMKFPLISTIDGTSQLPAITFQSCESSGLYLNHDDVCISSNSRLSATFTETGIKSNNYMLSDQCKITSHNNQIHINAYKNSLVIGDAIASSIFIADKYQFNNGGGLVASDKNIDLLGENVNIISESASINVGQNVSIYGQLVIDNANININKGILTTELGNIKKTYNSSETFIVTDANVHTGDIVGIKNNNLGQISKVLGYKWTDIPSESLSINEYSKTSLWDEIDCNDVHIFTEIRTIENIPVLTLNVSTIKNRIVIKTKSFELTPSTHTHYSVSICKINDNRYIVGFGKYNNIENITLRTIHITSSDDSTSLNVSVDDAFVYQTESLMETFDMTYESSSDLDILILSMYNIDSNNLDVVLFATNPSIQIGHSQRNISSDIIIERNKTLRSILIPGQIVICSYGNSKCFLLLPSNFNKMINIGDTLIDNNSSNCADLIYDMINSVIISVECTYTNSAYIKVSDIFGTKIVVLHTKFLGNTTCMPIGIGYNQITDNFVLFYADSSMCGQVYAQMFNHDGECISLGLIYTKGSLDHSYTNLEVDNVPIPPFGSQVYVKSSGIVIAEWTSSLNSSNLIYFNNNFGINPQAYVGIAMCNADIGFECEVALRGQIFTCTDLPLKYIGKKLYLSNIPNQQFPKNLTSFSHGNAFIGTCLSSTKILVGL